MESGPRTHLEVVPHAVVPDQVEIPNKVRLGTISVALYVFEHRGEIHGVFDDWWQRAAVSDQVLSEQRR
jgi:hypothetical protein